MIKQVKILILALFLLPALASATDLKALLKGQLNQKLEDKTQGYQSKDTQASIPLTGDISDEDEAKLGREIAGRVLGAAALVDNAPLQAYVNRVGRWVALQSDRPALNWSFGVLDSEAVNAFAAPGGYVLITKGLYRRLQNEHQLAGVLAHEIAHVQLRHQLKLIQQARQTDIAQNLIASKVDSNKGKQLLGNGAEVFVRKLDQKAEFEADRMGVVLASRAGYDAFGLPQVLQGLTGASGDQFTLLFATHPKPEDRLVALDNAMGEVFDKIKPAAVPAKRFVNLP